MRPLAWLLTAAVVVALVLMSIFVVSGRADDLERQFRLKARGPR